MTARLTKEEIERIKNQEEHEDILCSDDIKALLSHIESLEEKIKEVKSERNKNWASYEEMRHAWSQANEKRLQKDQELDKLRKGLVNIQGMIFGYDDFEIQDFKDILGDIKKTAREALK